MKGCIIWFFSEIMSSTSLVFFSWGFNNSRQLLGEPKFTKVFFPISKYVLCEWSDLIDVRTVYRKIWFLPLVVSSFYSSAILCNFLIDTAWKMPVYEVFLVCIFPHLDWIWKFTKYISVFSLNVGKQGPGNLRIWTIFAQCESTERDFREKAVHFSSSCYAVTNLG